MKEKDRKTSAIKRNLKVVPVVILVLVILATIARLSYNEIRSLTEADLWKSHTDVVLRELEELLSALKDVETGQRGFIITKDEKFLEPYNNALSLVERKMSALRRLTSDNQSQQRRLDILQPLIKEKLDFSALTIDARTADGFTPAYDLVATGKGKMIMDRIRVVVSQAIDEETRLLAERNAKKQAYFAGVLRATLWGTALSVALSLLAGFLLQREINARILVEEDLRSHHDKLEDLVRARTEELVESREAAEAAGVAKTRFLANMSHEMRTPLSAIIGFNDLVTPDMPPEEQKSYRETIRTAALSLLRIIEDIIDFSLTESGRMEFRADPFNIRDAVTTTVATFEPATALKGLKLSVVVDENVPEVMEGDGPRLRQVMLNIVGNAVKFTGKGGIAVNVRKESDPERRSEVILFTVRDTGIGIPPDQLSQLFEKFSQVDPSSTKRFGGTGMGLALSRELIEGMGGKIWVESELETGTTFFFALPLSRGSSL